MLTIWMGVQQAWAGVGGAAAAPSGAPDLPFWPHLLKVLAVLTGLVGVLLLVQYFWRRIALPMKGGQPLIQVLDTHYLAPKRSLVLVQVWKQRFLLAHTGEGLTLLASLQPRPGDDPEAAPPPSPGAPGPSAEKGEEGS
ncbi:MAG: flagellar biosynthetic protein FliO [Deltaproteobacteria bacterium]|nr:flagellar biosynthetic protein FliO [Deltaproteobacteria bacterium]